MRISDWSSDVCSSDLAVVEQEFGEGFGQLRLADAGRAEKEETPQRPVRVLQPGTAASDGSGHGLYRVRLANDALGQLLLHVKQLFTLALHHLVDRNARPARYDRGDVLVRHFLAQHCALCHGLRLFRLFGERSEERRAGTECVSPCMSRWLPVP